MSRLRVVELDQSRIPPRLHVGTSSFSSEDWIGRFYPLSARPADFLPLYATRLRTVEIDATWHVMPSVRTVESWARRTPPGFVFSMKVPKVITHQKYLEGCENEWREFLIASEALGEKRGPLVLQFQYVSRTEQPEEWETGADFLRRLRSFVDLMPPGVRYVIEVRNERWIQEPLLTLLRERGIALALVDYFTMPSGPVLMQRIDPVTTDFAYVRFLGHHREMDLMVAEARERGLRHGDWDSLILDRTEETQAWLPTIQHLLGRNLEVFVYFNNHYAGFAPGSVEIFLQLWDRAVER